MNKPLRLLSGTATAALISLLLTTGCAELNDPYYSGSGGYRDPYDYRHDDYRRDDYRYDSRRDRERREVERERERLEQERRRLEDERRHDSYRPPPPPPRAEEHCPSGFSPSEQKCSSDERRRGCKDIRLPSGLGCVRR